MDENQQRIQAQSSLGSDTASEQSESIEPQNVARTICLVGAAADNPDTVNAAKSFVNATIVTSETGIEFLGDSSTLFVLPSFEGGVFDALYKAKRILLGPPALQQLSHTTHPLPINTRPLYSLAMSGIVVCVTGFRDKETLGELVTIVHQLGGSIRKDLSQKVTHLIANYTGGAKYEYADTFRLPVMQRSWVLSAWERRDEIGFVATEEAFLAQHKLKPFYGARVCFLGFAKEEEKDMINVLQENGGAITTKEDPSCTHVVVDDGGAPSASVTDKTDTILRAHLVKAEWFWTSVQKETCLPVKNYMFEGHIDGIISPPPTPSHPSTSTPSSSTPTHSHTPSSASRRKRKRLHETLSSLAQATTPHHLKPTGSGTASSSPRLQLNNRQQSLNIEGVQAAAGSSTIGKQRRSSSASDGGLLGLSVTGGSFVLDCTASPGLDLVGPVVGLVGINGTGQGVKEAMVVVKESKRQQVFQELVHTESNYVNILHTIVTTFKKHLEDAAPPDQLLNPTELKIIFGRVPLIYTTHLHMLNSLRTALASYSDSATSVGDIILRFSTDLLHAYPPFINAYEDMKSMLEKCDREKPRFHAFLKACQTRPECGRQGLSELMIRPVQRLGSVSLLLNDILKHTAKSHPDHALLVQALASIKEVLSQINEDKRKAEGQRVMFDIFNEIDNCPPDVVSSHRSFVARCDVIQLSSSDNTVTTSKGTPLCLFLFSDQLGICKRRNNHRSNSNPFPINHQPPIIVKSPTNTTSNNQQLDTAGAHSLDKHGTLNGTIGGHHKVGGGSSGCGGMNGIGLTVGGVKAYKHVKMMSLSAIRRVIDIKDTEDCQRVCSLIFMNNGELKEKLFSFAITDDEVDKTSFLKTLCHQMATNACTADSEKFMAYCEAHQLDIDTSYLHGTLSKAVKFAYRTRLKVGRAFSFNKTPAKLKRAVSSMMSPFGSSNNLTPASQLAQMRLASYSNINELGHTTNTESAPIAPLSVQPTRKIKPSSLGVGVLKRL